MNHRLASLFALAAAACSSPASDVCASASGTCLDLTVTSASVMSIDTLDITASGAATGTRTSTLGQSTPLPVHVAVRFAGNTSGSLSLDVVGRLAGSAVGHGSTTLTLAAGQHALATVDLSSGTPVDMTLPHDGATPDMGGCVPLSARSCLDPNTIERCRANGTGYEFVPCARGCDTVPAPHCMLVVPTGIVSAGDFNTAGVMNTTIANAILHTDSGQIEGIRPPSGDPTMMSVANGIGHHVVTSGGSTVGVFVFDSLTITGKLKIVGVFPAVLLANGDVTLGEIDAAADCVASTPGPGGFAGGTPVAPAGLGPGGGGVGAFATFHGGGGGGGHGDKGGNGATVSGATGGMGGIVYDMPGLALLRGGSGGGVSMGGTARGGDGGGAVQVVSQTKILINGGIAAGGCGGEGKNDNSCGGGGAGGALLLEAPTITITSNGYLCLGGGGGGGTSDGHAAGNSLSEMFVSLGGLCGASRCGGNGAYSAQSNGLPGMPDAMSPGCGGGGAGRIRINTLTGAAVLSMVSTLYVPTIASGLLTQGTVVVK